MQNINKISIDSDGDYITLNFFIDSSKYYSLLIGHDNPYNDAMGLNYFDGQTLIIKWRLHYE